MTIRKYGVIVGLLAILLSLPRAALGQVAVSPSPGESEPGPAQPTVSAAQPAAAPAAATTPRLYVTTDEGGGPILTIEFPWRSYARPSLQMAVIDAAQPDPAALQPLPLDGQAAIVLWESLVGKINKPVHAGSDELLQTVTTFLPLNGGALLRVRAMVNSLGKTAAFGVESKDRNTAVFYLLEGWSDAPDRVRMRWSDLDRAGKVAEAAQLRVWFLSEEKVVWQETIASSDAKPEKPEQRPVAPASPAEVNQPVTNVPPVAAPPAVVGTPSVPVPPAREVPSTTTLTSPAPATNMDDSGAGQPRSLEPPPSKAALAPSAATASPAVSISRPASPVSNPAPAENATIEPAHAAATVAPVPAQPPSEPAAKAPASPAGAAVNPPLSIPARGQASKSGGSPAESGSGPGEKTDLREMTTDELAAYIEQRWGKTMEPAVRKAWAGGWWNYYQVENPEPVRREVFMKLLKTCYREQPPGELRECFALLYLRLKQK